MSFNLTKKITFIATIDGKDEELTSEGLKAKINEARNQIKDYNAAINSLNSFIDKAESLLYPESGKGSHPKTGFVERTKSIELKMTTSMWPSRIDRVLKLFEADENVSLSTKQIMDAVALPEGPIRDIMTYLVSHKRLKVVALTVGLRRINIYSRPKNITHPLPAPKEGTVDVDVDNSLKAATSFLEASLVKDQKTRQNR